MKDRSIELRERALGLLAVSSMYDVGEIRRNFLRQLRLVHEDARRHPGSAVPGFDDGEIARLLIQAYSLLIGRRTPTTMLENDRLVGTLLGFDQITPMNETADNEDVFAARFYDQFQHSIWP